MDPHALTKLFRAFPEPGDPILGQIKQKDIKNSKSDCFFKVTFLKMVFRDLIRSGLSAMGLGPMAEGHGLTNFSRLISSRLVSLSG